MRALRVSALMFLALGLSSCFLIPMDEAVYGLTTTGEGKLPEESWSDIDYSKFAGQTLWFYQDLKAGVPCDIRFADATEGSDLVDVNGGALDIVVTAYAADKTTVIMSEMDKGYAEGIDTVHRYTPPADMRLYLKVTPKDTSANTGKFKIRCTPLTLLTDGVTTSGTLTDSNYYTGNWYYYKNTTAATVKLKVTYPNGGASWETLTLAYSADSTNMLESLDSYSSFNSVTFAVSPNSSYYFYVLPYSWSSSYLGGYSIQVSTSSTSKQVKGTLGVWMDEEITDTVSKVTFEYDTVVGQNYAINWNDRWDGDSTKTLIAFVGAGSTINGALDYFGNSTDGYSYGKLVTATSSKIYISVVGYIGSYTGTFSLKVAQPSPITQTGTFEALITGTMTVATPSITYTFNTTPGETYSVYFYDQYSGYSLNGALDASSVASGAADLLSGAIVTYSANFWYVVPGGSKLYVTVRGAASTETGTFGLKVSHIATTQLTAGTWTGGTITSSSVPCYFAYPTTVGASYTVFWDDKFQGTNSGLTSSLYTQVNARPANGTGAYYFGNSNYGYTYGYSTGQTFTATSNEAVVLVWPYVGETGTFKIKVVQN